jgi:hypothetical protein
MDISSPRGIIVDRINDSTIVIKTTKRNLVFSDYVGLFIACWGLVMWLFGVITDSFNGFSIPFSVIFFGLISILLYSLLNSFNEIQTITVTNDSIEINKKHLILTSREKLDTNLINRIDFKDLRFPSVSIPNFVVFIKFVCNFGFYKVPRIVYNNCSFYFFEHYDRSSRMWIVDYLNELIKKN